MGDSRGTHVASESHRLRRFHASRRFTLRAVNRKIRARAMAERIKHGVDRDDDPERVAHAVYTAVSEMQRICKYK